jgi:hypothetical protein
MERTRGPLVPLGQVSEKTKLKRGGGILGCHMLMMSELSMVGSLIIRENMITL